MPNLPPADQMVEQAKAWMQGFAKSVFAIVSNQQIEPQHRDLNKILGWMVVRGWNAPADIYSAAGFKAKVSECESIDQKKASSPYYTASAPSTAVCFENLYNELCQWGAKEYTLDVHASQGKSGGSTIADIEKYVGGGGKRLGGSGANTGGEGDTGGGSLSWEKDKKTSEGIGILPVLGIGAAVVAIGAYAYHASKKAKSNPAMLSTQDTPKVEKLVRKAATARFGRKSKNERRDIFFEHGQWWMVQEDSRYRRTYSVADYVPGVDYTGLDFELTDETEW